ncbi:MAG: 3-isopropylmalate dehydratase small subunit [Thermoleophilia bacterium]|nr:3-isopropylmalate dehydratase small subunit [Thermoleophilia bacterium]
MRTTGRVAVLDRPDVDTDQIVPKQFLKRIERTGWADALFFDWRRDPDFELNNPAFAGARILLAGHNFGCGSSREHAPWALQDYGFEVIVAPSFADIFNSNCVQIGLVPIVLPPERVRELMALVDREHGSELSVDLEQQTITAPGGEVLHFPFDASQRHRLLNGLDDIGVTLAREAEITAYESARPAPIDTLAVS